MRLILAVTVLLAFVAIASTKPVPPPTAKSPDVPAASAIPNLAGDTNWGVIAQTGRAIQITGHASWFAVGAIRDDGRVQVVWTLTDESKAGIGVYEVGKDGNLTGHWQWGENATLDKNGDLVPAEDQSLLADRVYKIKPGVPDVPEPFR